MILIFKIAAFLLSTKSFLSFCNATKFNSPSSHYLEQPLIDSEPSSSSFPNHHVARLYSDYNGQTHHGSASLQKEIQEKPSHHRGENVASSSISETRQPFTWYNVVKDSQGRQKYTLANSANDHVAEENPLEKAGAAPMQPDSPYPYHAEATPTSHSFRDDVHWNRNTFYPHSDNLDNLDYMSESALLLSKNHAMGDHQQYQDSPFLPSGRHSYKNLIHGATSDPLHHQPITVPYPAPSYFNDMMHYISQQDTNHDNRSPIPDSGKQNNEKEKEDSDGSLIFKKSKPAKRYRDRKLIGPPKRNRPGPKETDDPGSWRYKLIKGQISRVYEIYMELTGARYDTAHHRLIRKCTRELAHDLLSENIEKQREAIKIIGIPQSRSGGPRELFLGKHKKAITKKLCDRLELNAKKVNVMLARKLDAKLGDLLKSDDHFEEGVRELTKRPYNYYKNYGMISAPPSAKYPNSSFASSSKAVDEDQLDGDEPSTSRDESEDSSH